jgi:hypothetical protein
MSGLLSRRYLPAPNFVRYSPSGGSTRKHSSEHANSKATPKWAGYFQFGILVALLTFESFRWLTVMGLFKASATLFMGPFTWAESLLIPNWALLTYWMLFITMPGRVLTTALVGRILMAGVKPGNYDRGGWVHLRLWAAERFVGLSGINPIIGTQWCRRYAWLLGCRVDSSA